MDRQFIYQNDGADNLSAYGQGALKNPDKHHSLEMNPVVILLKIWKHHEIY